MHVLTMPVICTPTTYPNAKKFYKSWCMAYVMCTMSFHPVKSSIVICACDSLSISCSRLSPFTLSLEKWQTLMNQQKKTWPSNTWKWRTNAPLHVPFFVPRISSHFWHCFWRFVALFTCYFFLVHFFS